MGQSVPAQRSRGGAGAPGHRDGSTAGWKAAPWGNGRTRGWKGSRTEGCEAAQPGQVRRGQDTAVGTTICSATAQPHSVNPRHNPRHGQNTERTARPTAQPHSSAPRHSTTAQPHSTAHGTAHGTTHGTPHKNTHHSLPPSTAPQHSPPAQHHDAAPWLEAPTRTDSPSLDSQKESQYRGAAQLPHGALLASWQHAECPMYASLSPVPF